MLDPAKLRQIRIDRNLTQTQLAVQIGADQSLISELEADPPRRNPLLLTVELLAGALEVPVTDLLSPNPKDLSKLPPKGGNRGPQAFRLAKKKVKRP